jgi:hypothetical protein
MSKIINLYALPYEVMLIVEHPSGVVYENQVGGTLCWQARAEGILAPVDLEPNAVEQIMKLPYDEGRRGITAEVADGIDAVLAASSGGRYLKVDRERLGESWEAWVFVVADIPESSEHQLEGPYFGAPRGFGRSTGVLTWPNSD